jgi:hypothetical protein
MLRRQLRSALKAAGITDLKQLEGRCRSEVLLLLRVSAKSLATIEMLLEQAGLAALAGGAPQRRKPGRRAKAAPPVETTNIDIET